MVNQLRAYLKKYQLTLLSITYILINIVLGYWSLLLVHLQCNHFVKTFFLMPLCLFTWAMMQVNNQRLSMCWLCGEHSETVEHLVSGCSPLASQQYKSRHDHAARYKILWDCNIYCDRLIRARWLDITIFDKTAKLITLVDVSILADKRVVDKEDWKISK